MKKFKVVLVEHSEKLDDGNRKLLGESVICTCSERGTAELIKHLLEPSYDEIINHNDPNRHIYHLAIKY